MRAGGQEIDKLNEFQEQQRALQAGQIRRRADDLSNQGDQAVTTTQFQIAQLEGEIEKLRAQEAELPQHEETNRLQLEAEREKIAGGERQLEAAGERFKQLFKQAQDTSQLLTQSIRRYINDAIAWRIEKLQEQIDEIKASGEDAMFRFFAAAVNFASTVADGQNRVRASSPRSVRPARQQPSHGDVEGLQQRLVAENNLVSSTRAEIEAQRAEVESQKKQVDLAADRLTSQMKLEAERMARGIAQAEKNKALFESRKGEIRAEANRAAKAALDSIPEEEPT